MASVTNRFYIQDDSHQLVTSVRATLGTDVSFKQETHYLRGQDFFLLYSGREERARSIRPLALLIKPNRNRKAESKLHNYTGLSLSLSLDFVFYLVSDPFFPSPFLSSFSRNLFVLSPRRYRASKIVNLARNTSTSSVRTALKN